MKILPGAFVVVGETLRGGAGEARAARQPGALRQRHRLAVDRARPRCLGLRSGRAAARDPRDQRQQERPRARHRLGEAREPDRAAARPARSAAMAASPLVGTPAMIADEMEEWLADGGLRRLQHHVPLSARRARRLRRPRGAGTAAARAVPARIRGHRRCARISACRGRRTASSSSMRTDRAAGWRSILAEKLVEHRYLGQSERRLTVHRLGKRLQRLAIEAGNVDPLPH